MRRTFPWALRKTWAESNPLSAKRGPAWACLAQGLGTQNKIRRIAWSHTHSHGKKPLLLEVVQSQI